MKITEWEFETEQINIEYLPKSKWEHHSFYDEESFAKRELDAYKQSIQAYQDTMKLELRGIDNGIYVDFHFLPEGAKWFLIEKKDYSD